MSNDPTDDGPDDGPDDATNDGSRDAAVEGGAPGAEGAEGAGPDGRKRRRRRRRRPGDGSPGAEGQAAQGGAPRDPNAPGDPNAPRDPNAAGDPNASRGADRSREGGRQRRDWSQRGGQRGGDASGGRPSGDAGTGDTEANAVPGELSGAVTAGGPATEGGDPNAPRGDGDRGGGDANRGGGDAHRGGRDGNRGGGGGRDAHRGSDQRARGGGDGNRGGGGDQRARGGDNRGGGGRDGNRGGGVGRDGNRGGGDQRSRGAQGGGDQRGGGGGAAPHDGASVSEDGRLSEGGTRTDAAIASSSGSTDNEFRDGREGNIEGSGDSLIDASKSGDANRTTDNRGGDQRARGGADNRGGGRGDNRGGGRGDNRGGGRGDNRGGDTRGGGRGDNRGGGRGDNRGGADRGGANQPSGNAGGAGGSGDNADAGFLEDGTRAEPQRADGGNRGGRDRNRGGDNRGGDNRGGDNRGGGGRDGNRNGQDGGEQRARGGTDTGGAAAETPRTTYDAPATPRLTQQRRPQPQEDLESTGDLPTVAWGSDDAGPPATIVFPADLPVEAPSADLDPLTYPLLEAASAHLGDDIISVLGVRFQIGGRIQWCDPGETDFARGDRVLVDSERGQRLATVATPPTRRATRDRGLRRVIRRANEQDLRGERDVDADHSNALRIAKDVAANLRLPLKVFRVELIGQGQTAKLNVYYTSDERLDLREFIQTVGRETRARLELRQLGVRDEAKAVGGIGSCGLTLCCTTWLPDFVPVSIKMAKDQGLVLSPTKVAGQCGRLKCCLVYEQAAYAELRKGLPKLGKRVISQRGEGRVVEVDVLRQRIRVSYGMGDTEVLPATEVKPLFPAGNQPRAPRAEGHGAGPAHDHDHEPELEAEPDEAPAEFPAEQLPPTDDPSSDDHGPTDDPSSDDFQA